MSIFRSGKKAISPYSGIELRHASNELHTVLFASLPYVFISHGLSTSGMAGILTRQTAILYGSLRACVKLSPLQTELSVAGDTEGDGIDNCCLRVPAHTRTISISMALGKKSSLQHSREMRFRLIRSITCGAAIESNAAQQSRIEGIMSLTMCLRAGRSQIELHCLDQDLPQVTSKSVSIFTYTSWTICSPSRISDACQQQHTRYL